MDSVVECERLDGIPDRAGMIRLFLLTGAREPETPGGAAGPGSQQEAQGRDAGPLTPGRSEGV